ncbi:MAG: hypothetical protein HZA61_14905 [Candidatus Eisenbacteria bacterium]|uniref:Glycine zipper domain-containing protein n=1 Tax=Eiseniibacteriota bacterium TaxID=2212470 RepID=A0A933SDX1_UNCEI|nr:hypothetical protein [Candidatus Eisenbacteria bacterium]
MLLRRSSLLTAVVLMLAVSAFVAGCGKKADEPAAGGAMSDSLLASAPTDTAVGGLAPQEGFQSGESVVAETPTPAPSKPASTKPAPKPAPKPVAAPTATVPAGTGLKVKMETPLNTETAKAGQSWAGTISEAVTVGTYAPFPAGSVVHGVVEAVEPAEKGSRAFFVLRVTSIEANGKSHAIGATADSLIAGSTRKRNVGAVAGGAAAGALLGKAIGGSTKGAVIGGIIGGAAATGAVAASKGFQVDVPAGKELVFKVDSDTKLKL